MSAVFAVELKYVALIRMGTAASYMLVAYPGTMFYHVHHCHGMTMSKIKIFLQPRSNLTSFSISAKTLFFCEG